MKTKIAAISAVLALLPYAAMADLDPTTLIQDQLLNYQEELNKYAKELTGQELDLQRLVNSRDKLEEIKNQGKNFAMDYAMSYGSKIKIRSLSVKGVSEQIKGNYSNPELEKTVASKMTQKTNTSEDIKKAQAQRKLINQLQVENVASMYAKALVLRRSIINEEADITEEEKTEMTDLTQIEDAYKAVGIRANGRWKTILDSQANFFGQQATAEILTVRLNEAAEAEEEAEAAAKSSSSGSEDGGTSETSETGGTSADNSTTDSGGVSLTDLYNTGSSTWEDISSGDYSGAVSGLSGVAGDLGYEDIAGYGSDAADYYNKGSDVINDVSSGNYGGAVSGLSGVAGDLGYEDVADTLGDVSDYTNIGTNALNNVENGNWGGLVSNATQAASQAGVSSDITQYGSTASSAVDSVSKGDWQGAADNVASGVSQVNANKKSGSNSGTDASPNSGTATNSSSGSETAAASETTSETK